MEKIAKVSVVVTVFNEAKTISTLLESLLSQSLAPDEIVIVDAKSSDGTQDVVSSFITKHKQIKLFEKQGNRSVGRNFGIEQSINEIIAITDAGCIPEKKWLQELVSPFKNNEVKVVSGYYKGLPNSDFEKCLIPFVLVMPDRLDEKLFLPSTRSMAIKKSTWHEVGKFNTEIDPGEDYEFANRLVSNGVYPHFAKKAVVGWYPRKDLYSAAKMFYSFARADARFKNPRNNLNNVFMRMLILIWLILATLINPIVFPFLIAYVIVYSILAIMKNFKYVRTLSALVYLPLLQLCVDYCVFTGTLSGYWLK